MKKRAQFIFFFHALIAAYCVACGLLEMVGQLRSWLIPGIVMFYLLAASAILFPIVALVSVAGSGCRHPVLLVAAHFLMGGAQFFFGLLPLIS